MGELLTTGEMIDRLKVGEVATGDISALGVEVKVIKDEVGHIKFCDTKHLLELSAGIVNEVKWRILPRYVSFEKSIKALGDGKIIKVELRHPEETYEFLIDNDQFYYRNIKRGDDRFYEADMNSNIGISGRLITHGKWTIEGDSNV